MARPLSQGLRGLVSVSPTAGGWGHRGIAGCFPRRQADPQSCPAPAGASACALAAPGPHPAGSPAGSACVSGRPREGLWEGERRWSSVS